MNHSVSLYCHNNSGPKCSTSSVSSRCCTAKRTTAMSTLSLTATVAVEGLAKVTQLTLLG
jgi:hypothetical protein